MDRQRRGTALVVAGIGLLVATVLVGAATAPAIGTAGGDGAPETLVGSQGGPGGWHVDGNVYLLAGSDRVWNEASADSYFDVTRRGDGTVLAGFMHSGYTEGCDPHGSPCVKTGYRVIDPDAADGPSVIDEYAFPVARATNSEVHDVEQLGPETFLLTDMARERIFIVENGTQTWEWTADPFYTAPEVPTGTDWLHINDVDVVNESHYLVSVRNANQIVLVERGQGVVEVINADWAGSSDEACADDLVGEDPRCGDPDVLNEQHNPQWLDRGAVLVADSENDRIVELHRNTSTGRWEPAWTLTSAEGQSLFWPRDADRLPNGNTLVTDTRNGRLLEVSENGSVVWSYRTDGIPYEAERLPVGESVGGQRYAKGAVEGPRGEVPGLSLALVGLRSVVPSLPFWFTEAELGLSLVSLGLIGAGGITRWRT
jgi:hypothetical protein